MKKAITYLRFSSDDQSHHSIERQQLVTGTWLKANNILLTDSFKDEGFSAKTFDRPDVKALLAFIKKNYINIDYLVVSELTRFSREAGEAITIIKKIQSQYNIKIVSASRNQIYDVYDSSSFLMMGLEFLLGNTENIKRASDINGGIYTAKAIKGKWIQGGPAPFGYRKEGTGDQRRLVVLEEQAAVIRYIFDAYMKDVPVYIIHKVASEMGLKRKGSSAIQEILKNPLFISYQFVKSWRDQPGGIHPIKNLTPIVDATVFFKVQEKFKRPKFKKTIADDLPLRGVLRCHCKKYLTGAPSTNKIGKPYLYYKCASSKHLNLSAPKAHNQLDQVLQHLSLSDEMIKLIREESSIAMKQRLQENNKQLQQARAQLSQIKENMFSIEKKFIQENSISPETYQRWHQQLIKSRIEVAAEIEKFSRDEAATWWLLQQNLEKLTDMRFLYNNISTTDKHELLKQVFDDGLYYQTNTYRTHWLIEAFTHNLQALKENSLLIVDGWDYSATSSPVRWR